MKSLLMQTLVAGAILAASLLPHTFAEEARPDPSVKATIFLPFDFYGRNREALGLNADQARELERLAESIREPAKKLEGERAARTRALMETMTKSPVDLDVAMTRFQAVLEAENEAKSLQFRAGIAMRNTLNSEQLRQLHILAMKDGGARASGAAAMLNERIQQLRAELHKREGGEPGREVMAQLKQIEQTAREGRAGEAKAQLEELLRQLRRQDDPGAQAPAASKESPR